MNLRVALCFFLDQNRSVPSSVFFLTLILFLWSLPFLQPFHWLFEWGQVLTPYVPLVVLVALFFAKKKSFERPALCFMMFISCFRLLDIHELQRNFELKKTSSTSSNSFCLISANVLTQNPTPERAVEEIKNFLCKDRSNLLIVIEVNSTWVERHLKGLEPMLPLVSARPQENNFGMAVYSDMKMEEFRWLNIGSKTEFPAFHAYIPKGTKVISAYGVHIMPPLSYEKSMLGKENRKKIFEVFDKDKSLTKIIAGDFNATPGSWALGQFEEKDLRLATNGHYLDFTWKLPLMPWAWFDHVLLTEDLHVAEVKTSNEFGSDHRMIKALIEW